MRGINDRFISDLQSGELACFLQRVKDNPKLAVCIRGDYINIYYRGGNLLRITQKRQGYLFEFDEKYCLGKKDTSGYEIIKAMDKHSPTVYESHFERLIHEMDTWFSEHPKPERQYQHNLIISNPSVIDIEYQIGKGKRFDMLMVQDGKLIIVENKYGQGAITGSSGLAKHYRDICDAIKDEQVLSEMKKSVIRISENKFKLGLTDEKHTAWEIDSAATEILFLVAGFNPKSETIKNEVQLMDKSIPARLLLFETEEYMIDYSKTVDLFAYGN